MNQATKLSKSSKTDEHYTPEFILDFARMALGVDNFDLDPATDVSNPTRANLFYTEADDGLSKDWFGKVWLNPPFSKNKEFAQHVIEQVDRVDSMLVLAKADFRTKWSKLYLDSADRLIILNDYVRFVGSSNSAIFSVCLYGYHIHRTNLKLACDKYPQFKSFR